jgi:hypothetical protein
LSRKLAACPDIMLVLEYHFSLTSKTCDANIGFRNLWWNSSLVIWWKLTVSTLSLTKWSAHILVKLDFKLYTGIVLIYSIIINSQYNIIILM